MGFQQNKGRLVVLKMAAHLTIVAQKVVLFFLETMDEAPDECTNLKEKVKETL